MLRSIEAKDIGKDWDLIRAGLLIVKQYTTDDWLPEDVYMLLKNGAATLYIGNDDQGNYLGFMVMRLLQTFHGSKVEIWCAYSATKRPMWMIARREIKEIAAKAGAQRISFSSARNEWHQVAKRHGFAEKQTSYELTL